MRRGNRWSKSCGVAQRASLCLLSLAHPAATSISLTLVSRYAASMPSDSTMCQTDHAIDDEEDDHCTRLHASRKRSERLLLTLAEGH